MTSNISVKAAPFGRPPLTSDVGRFNMRIRFSIIGIIVTILSASSWAKDQAVPPAHCGLQVLGASIVGFVLGVAYASNPKDVCLPPKQQEAFEAAFKSLAENPSPIKVNGESTPYDVADVQAFLTRVFPCK